MNCKHFEVSRNNSVCIWCRKDTPKYDRFDTDIGNILWYFAQDIIELTNGQDEPRKHVPNSSDIWDAINCIELTGL